MQDLAGGKAVQHELQMGAAGGGVVLGDVLVGAGRAGFVVDDDHAAVGVSSTRSIAPRTERVRPSASGISTGGVGTGHAERQLGGDQSAAERRSLRGVEVDEVFEIAQQDLMSRPQ